MADKKTNGREKLSLRHSYATKRSFKGTDPFAVDNSSIESPGSHDQDDSSSSHKKFKSYRDHKIESLDADSFKAALDSQASLDSQTWRNTSSSNPSLSPSASRNVGLGSLELNSMIDRYDNATLNSLNMSQMSYTSEDAVSSPFPQTVDMASSFASRNFSGLEVNSFVQRDNDATMNSLSWSQSTMMSFSENTMASSLPQALEKTSSLAVASETSSANLEETHYAPVSQENLSADTSNINFSHDSLFKPNTKDNTNSRSASDYVAAPIDISTKDWLTIAAGQKVVKSEKCLESNHEQRNCEENIEAMRNTVGQVQENILRGRDSEGNDKGQPHATPGKSGKSDQSSVNKTTTYSEPEKIMKHESNFELTENFKTCKKDPSHDRFFSPQDLKVANLPLDIQHEDAVTLFQCLSKLVVQISVTSTSDNRSKNDMYRSYIGTNNVRNGSGFIVSTDKQRMKIKCINKDCSHDVKDGNSSTFTELSVLDSSPSNMSTAISPRVSSRESLGMRRGEKKHFVFGGIHVRTNRHVIFDKSETDNACVNFFFQSSDKKGVVKGHVASILGVNNEQDHIVLHVMSHNKLLLDMIDLHLRNAKSSYIQMIKSTHNTQQYHSHNKLSWVSVISHPHGTASSISFGRLKKEKAEVKRVIKYYDAATCPGSSGGLVITPTLLQVQWPGAVHSSFCEVTKCNVSLDSRSQELDASDIGLMYKNILNKEDSIPENQFRL